MDDDALTAALACHYRLLPSSILSLTLYTHSNMRQTVKHMGAYVLRANITVLYHIVSLHSYLHNRQPYLGYV